MEKTKNVLIVIGSSIEGMIFGLGLIYCFVFLMTKFNVNLRAVFILSQSIAIVVFTTAIGIELLKKHYQHR